jgi:hypothetical protein
MIEPKVVAGSNLGLKLANAFGVFPHQDQTASVLGPKKMRPKASKKAVDNF